MASILDDINKLLEMKMGDTDRLTRIKESYQKDGFMDVGDRIYIGELTEHFLDAGDRHGKPLLSKLRHLLSRLWYK